jgi:hypothetical protein
MKKFVTCLTAVLFIAACSTTFAKPPPGKGNEGNPGILPPQSHPYGMTYAEWSAKWWQWALPMPFDHSPLAETADCSEGQSGPVWFLGGSFVGAEAVRNCTVPAGKAIFFPVFNVECSTAEPVPFHGDTEAELRACAKSWVDGGTGFCTIDGVLVQNLEAYRVQSPLFSFGPLPANNVLVVPAGSSGQSISDGYWLMLAPLPKGGHVIDFVGIFSQANGGFAFHITYNLTVE